MKRTRVRNWCITANHKSEDKEKALRAFLEDPSTDKKLLWPDDISNFLVFQLEKGSGDEANAGTYHIQAYIECKKAIELNPLIKKLSEKHVLWQGAHYEETRKEKASIAYCIKQETRIAGPWRFGTPKEQGKRTDLEEIAENIKENGLRQAILDAPDMYIKYNRGMKELADFYANENACWKVPEVTIIYGETGLGKSKTVYAKYQYNQVARAMYQKDGDSYKIWFQNYNYQPCIMFDEFSDIKCPLDLMKMYTDGHPCDMNIKTTSKVRYNCESVYIITNKSPSSFYKNAAPADMRAFIRRISKILFFEKEDTPIELKKETVFAQWYNGTEVAEG